MQTPIRFRRSPMKIQWVRICIFCLLIFLFLSLAALEVEVQPKLTPLNLKINSSFTPLTLIKLPPPNLYKICKPTKKTKCVYLTFDDGPQEGSTKKILTILKKHKTPATFFLIGRQIKPSSKLMNNHRNAQQHLEVHTWSHEYLPKFSNRANRTSLKKTSDKIIKSVGRVPTCYRPPYGATNKRVRTLAKKLKLKEILWEVDPQDWTHPGANAIVSRVMSQVQPSAVILLHDGGGARGQTIQALPTIIKKLKARGYGFGYIC